MVSRREMMAGTAVAMLMLPLGRAEASIPAAPSELQGFRAFVHDLAARGRFSGAVLIAKNGRILFQQAFGYADRSFQAPNDLETRFNLGSMGKMFTAVAIMQLVEQGRLSLDQTVAELLPDYPDAAAAHKIRLAHLLSHTSGLGNIFGPRYDATPKDHLDKLSDYLPLIAEQQLMFEPGERWSYSNTGFLVLGLILEKVTDQSYFTYVRDKIYKPAGMDRTDSYRPYEVVPDLALGYMRPPSAPVASASGSPSDNLAATVISNVDLLARGTSAGGGYSTVGDLLRFAQALQNGRLLNRRSLELATTGTVSTGVAGEQYGYGFIETHAAGVRIFGHGGTFPGVSTNFDVFPVQGFVAVVLSNMDEGGRIVAERVRMTLTGQPIPKAIRLPASALQAFAGRYQPAPPPNAPRPARMPPLEVQVEGTGLSIPGRMTRHLFQPLSKDEFFDVENVAARITFLRDSDGRVTGAILKGVVAPVAVKATRLP